MVKVSGVPYEVDLPQEGYDLIAELEQENKYMRERMNRLEDENKRLEEEIIILRIDLHNAKQGHYGSGNH